LFDESLRYKWVFRIDQNIEKKLSDKKYLLETKKWRFLDSEVLKKYECIDEKHFADITFNLKDPKNTAYVTIFERLKDIILEDESVRIINNQDGAELSEQENINKKLKNELFKKDNLIINKEEELEKLMKKVEELEKRK